MGEKTSSVNRAWRTETMMQFATIEQTDDKTTDAGGQTDGRGREREGSGGRRKGKAGGRGGRSGARASI